MNSVIGGILNWVQHPTFETDNDPKNYAAFLALVVIVAFLWSRVVKQLVEN